MSDRRLSGSGFIISDEFHFLGKVIEVNSLGHSCLEQEEEEEVKEQKPVKLPDSFIQSALAGIPRSAETSGLSAFEETALSSLTAAGTVMVLQNKGSGQYQAEYIKPHKKVVDGAYIRKNKIDLKKITNDIVLAVDRQISQIPSVLADWNQMLEVLIEQSRRTDFLKGNPERQCAMVGDPVNINTGNFFYHHQDLEIDGVVPLCFERFYNRLDQREGSMGKGWRHNYEVCLFIEKEFTTIVWQDGREEIYQLRERELMPLFGVACRLKRNEDLFYYESEQGHLYQFDGEGKLLLVTYTNHQHLRLFYDALNRLVRVQNNYGQYLEYQYDKQSGYLTEVSDHSKRVVKLTYTLKRLAKVTNMLNQNYRYRYDRDQGLYQIENPQGVLVLQNEYDNYKRVAKQQFCDGGILQYHYEEAADRTLLILMDESRVSYQYDQKKRTNRIIYVDGEEVYEYNEQNLITGIIDKRRNKTRFSYNQSGNLMQVCYPDGRNEEMLYNEGNQLLQHLINQELVRRNAYDQNGQLVETADSLDRKYRFSYDQSGNIVRIELPDGHLWKMDYDTSGNMIQRSDQTGSTHCYVYDDLNRLVSSFNGNQKELKFQYDQNSRVKTIIISAADKINYHYSENGLLTKITDFSGNILEIKYDSMNQIRTITDSQQKKVILLEYNQNQKIVEVFDSEQGTFRYQYDLNGNLADVINTEGEQQFIYNSTGEKVNEIRKNGDTLSYLYDLCGRVSGIFDSKGRKLSCQYEEGHLEKIICPDGEILHIVYDWNGIPVEIKAGDGQRRIIYYNLLEKIRQLGRCHNDFWYRKDESADRLINQIIKQWFGNYHNKDGFGAAQILQCDLFDQQIASSINYSYPPVFERLYGKVLSPAADLRNFINSYRIAGSVPKVNAFQIKDSII